MSKVDTILEEIKGLTLLEASDLVKKMEETFGVSAAAAAVAAAAAAAAVAAVAAAVVAVVAALRLGCTGAGSACQRGSR